LLFSGLISDDNEICVVVLKIEKHVERILEVG
jgi:hypothetical protein